MANTSDIIGQLNSNGDDESTNTNDRIYLEYLKSIDESIQKLVKHADSVSQSAARNNVPRRDEYYAAQAQRNNGSRKRSSTKFGSSDNYSYNVSRKMGSIFDDFTDAFEKELIESVVGSDFKDQISRSMRGMASMLGVDLRDVPRELGKQFGKRAMSAFTKTDTGEEFTSAFTNIKNSAMHNITSKFEKVVNSADPSGELWKRYMSGYSEDPNVPHTETTPPESIVDDLDMSKCSINWDEAVITAGTVYLVLANKVESEKSAASANTEKATLSSEKRDNIPYTDVESEDVVDANTKSAVGDIVDPDAGLDVLRDNLFDTIGDELVGNLSNVTSAGSKLVGTLTSMSTAGASAAAGTAGFAAILGPAAIAIGAVVAGLFILDKIVDQLGPAIDGTKQLFETMADSANRFQKSREKNIELAQKRLADDVEAMIEEPFNILEDAANRVYEAWDANLRTINATQGYTKSDLQDLMSAYADRLRSEDLTAVVSGADITDNLAKVLESGLSGKIAEEFAYQATKLNAAVPTQDFFSYGEVYASIAANAMAAGKSQSEAIAYANDELNKFAGNILYASRQISGGFSTGLKDAQNLFESSVQIAQSSKDGVASEISGVLTAVAAATGAIAPDLASSIVDAVVKAATGGNSSELVALRSLAGINASNSEFLNSLTSDPQGVFSILFRNLANMQSQLSERNYMEVAEGLADVFGISMEAFQRVDFAYLAQAISEMNVNNNELNKNLYLLASGETTRTAEQLRYQQINKYMLEEGLAYVLDNEVARSIQEHMWEEQLAREMMESTYAVELKGSALNFLEGIRQTIENILSIFSPAMWFKKAVNLAGTVTESYAQEGDIVKLLEAGKVGQGNYQDLYNLTTRNVDLDLTDSLLSQLNSFSVYETTSTLRSISSFLSNPGVSANLAVKDILPHVKGAVASTVDKLTSALPDSNVSSKYDWRSVGKSISAALDYTAPYSEDYSANFDTSIGSSDSLSTSAALSRTSSMIEKLVSDVENYKSFDDWRSASEDLGIVDLDAALEETGRSVNMIKDYYQSKAAKEASDDMVTRYADEQDYRDKGRTSWEEERLFRNVTVPALRDEESAIWDEERIFRESTVPAFWEEERTVWESERIFREVTLPAFWEEERIFWNEQRTVWETEQTFRDVTLSNFWNEERAVWESERIFRDETLPARWLLEDQAGQRAADFYELAGGYLKTLDSNLKSFYDQWVDYFVNFTAYSERYSYSDVEKIQKEEKDGQSSAIYELAKALTQNTVDLKDPTLQTNALLSQILILVNTIVQQQNGQSSGAGSIAETLSALALGLVK